MNNRAIRILFAGTVLLLVAGIFFWRTAGRGVGLSPALPAVLIAGLGLVVARLRVRKRLQSGRTPRHNRSPVQRLVGGLIAACLLLGAFTWNHLHQPGGRLAEVDDAQALWLVLGLLILVAAVMVVVKHLQRDRDRQAR